MQRRGGQSSAHSRCPGHLRFKSCPQHDFQEKGIPLEKEIKKKKGLSTYGGNRDIFRLDTSGTSSLGQG